MTRPHTKPPRTGAEARFRRWVDRQLKANPDHPLNKILRDETTGTLRSNTAATVNAEFPGYDAGHMTTRSYKTLDGNEFFSVEDPLFNRGVAPEEKLGFSFQRDAVEHSGNPRRSSDCPVVGESRVPSTWHGCEQRQNPRVGKRNRLRAWGDGGKSR